MSDDELPAGCSRRSSLDDNPLRASADRSSESVDQVSRVTDSGDDGSDFSQTDITGSDSLEEQDREALAMERSSGLARSTGETFDYVESSDARSVSTTPMNENLEMTLPLPDDDGGSPIPRSVPITEHHSTDEAKRSEDVSAEDDDLEEQACHDVGSSADIQAGTELEKRETDLSEENSNRTEDLPVHEDDSQLVTEDQLENSTGHADAGSETQESQQDESNDGDLHQGTGKPEEVSEPSFASSNEQIEESRDGIAANHQEINVCGWLEENDEEEKTCSEVDLEQNRTQDDEHSPTLQQERDMPMVDSEPLRSELGEDHQPEQTTIVKKLPEDESSSSISQTLEIVHDLNHKDVISRGKVVDETRSTDDFQENDHNSALKPEQDSSVAAPTGDFQHGDHCVKEVEDYQKLETGPNFRQNLETVVAESDLAVTDQEKELRLAQDQTGGSGSDPRSCATNPDLFLDVRSASPTEGERQLQVAQCISPTWSEDDQKNNLLCLMDSRRKTQEDKSNWQLAHRIQDEMALVRDAELDDLENVQVSVKVRQLSLLILMINSDISTHTVCFVCLYSYLLFLLFWFIFLPVGCQL